MTQILIRQPSTLFRNKSVCAARSAAIRSLSSGGSLGGEDDDTDSVCELAASNLKYGRGATREVGQDVKDRFRGNRAIVFTDSNIRKLPCFETVLESLQRSNVSVDIYDRVRVEPNDASFRDAIDFMKQQEQNYDVVVAVGGGSVLDTAKAANLYACNPTADFFDFVNPPIGKGQPVPDGSLKPLIAIPTTAGTGSETTGVAIFDDSRHKAKTGIASRHLKPSLGIVDPDNTATLPRWVATYSGLDVLCHAIESYTAMPSIRRPRPASPVLRPAYQGSNPIADVWSLYALETCAENLPRAVQGLSDDIDARSKMLLASAAAGVGFGNAGVHLCHGMSYPISSQVKEYRGYEEADHALIPHGLSVIVNAPAVFSFTGVADPERHATCARILANARKKREGGSNDDTGNRVYNDPGAWLADEIRTLCQTLEVPLGLRRFGYVDDDIPALVEGTVPQHRVTKISPRPVGRPELESLFRHAMEG